MLCMHHPRQLLFGQPPCSCHAGQALPGHCLLTSDSLKEHRPALEHAHSMKLASGEARSAQAASQHGRCQVTADSLAHVCIEILSRTPTPPLSAAMQRHAGFFLVT